MRITTKGRYAIRAILNLADNTDNKPVSISSIAKKENLSPEFLEQIFFKLKKTDLISSVRGPGGGFLLNKKPEEISLKMIFDAVDEGIMLVPCTSGDSTEGCQNMNECLTHGIWKEATNHLNEYFDGITLADIIQKAKIQGISVV